MGAGAASHPHESGQAVARGRRRPGQNHSGRPNHYRTGRSAAGAPAADRLPGRPLAGTMAGRAGGTLRPAVAGHRPSYPRRDPASHRTRRQSLRSYSPGRDLHRFPETGAGAGTAGTGYPLANSMFSYSLLLVNQDGNQYPSHNVINGAGVTDPAGSATLSFSGIDGESQSYALLVYSYLNGLKGMGYYVHIPQSATKSVVPLIDSFQNRTVLIAHGDSVGEPPQPPLSSELNYNASFVILTEDYNLRQVDLDQTNDVGKVVYASGSGQEYASITLPDNDGILIVTYKSDTSQYGIVLMPWGFGSTAFELKFGGNSGWQEWVTTDIRQVTIGVISYQAKLDLWNLQGSSGVG